MIATNSGTKGVKKQYITFKTIDSLVACYTYHQTIQNFSKVGVLLSFVL